MPAISCEYCGGTDFYADAGFYFCSECQTQTQELREREFVAPAETLKVHKTKKIKSCSSKASTVVEQITSWECYNYILLGLVNELIEIGANRNLKPVVQTIWFSYLKKIEVLHKNVNQTPNLPAYNNKYDARILYGRKSIKKVYKRKRRTSCSSINTTASGESVISKREQSRLKRAMVEAAYETMSAKDSESTLHNTSLGSLKSSHSDSQSKKDGQINFSNIAKKELRIHMSKRHLKHHVEDTDVALPCHDMSYRNVSASYKTGPYVVTKAKLYAILYLGLLLIKDDIQLGDLNRFITEGALSFNFYQHFFPEDLDNQAKFIQSLHISKARSYTGFRLAASKLANLLDMNDDIPVQNIVDLIKRYCKELNLPGSICNLCINLLAETKPKFKITHLIPNYEAKAMCFIIFVLKLLFGLDGATEYKHSEFAKELKQNSFVFDSWLKTISYRRCVLAKYHFPTQFSCEQVDCKTYIDFINEYFHKYDIQRCEDMNYDVLEKLLFKADFERNTALQFNPSLTPICDNLKVLYDANLFDKDNLQTSILLPDLEHNSIDFLYKPEQFLPKGAKLIPKGANENLKFIPVYCATRPYIQLKTQHTCKFSFHSMLPETKSLHELDAQEYVQDFGTKYKHSTVTLATNNGSKLSYNKHYSSEKCFWLRMGTDINSMTVSQFDTYFSSFPYTFQIILSECASIICQTVKELTVEYGYFETYVCYADVVAKMNENKKCNSKRKAKVINCDYKLQRLIRAAIDHW